MLTKLKEVAIQFIKSQTDPLNSSAADKLEESLEQLLAFIKREDRILFEKDASDTVKKDILHLNNTVSEESPLVKFQLSPLVKFKPKICDLSNGWDLPLQESIGIAMFALVTFPSPSFCCSRIVVVLVWRIRLGLQVSTCAVPQL